MNNENYNLCTSTFFSQQMPTEECDFAFEHGDSVNSLSKNRLHDELSLSKNPSATPSTEVLAVLRPICMVLTCIGLLPVIFVKTKSKRYVAIHMSLYLFIYSIAMFVGLAIFSVHIAWRQFYATNNVGNEGRFEDAVFDYLRRIYLMPIGLNVLVLLEAKRQISLLEEWISFENLYVKTSRQNLKLTIRKNALILTIILPLLACAIIAVAIFTMVPIEIYQVIPYCYINTVTILMGGYWYLQCQIVGCTATRIAKDFQVSLNSSSLSRRITEYRSLWMKLAKLSQNIGITFGYSMAFICLYLFLVITLTIYGLLSQIQNGFSLRDAGLTISALYCIALLFFISNEAHFASNSVRVQFQKNLLLVELSWMNDDSHREINMFLRATEMYSTHLSLSGFFDVNRNLFKSLLATMVTYLVVLLQFQISIPESDQPQNKTLVAL